MWFQGPQKIVEDPETGLVGADFCSQIKKRLFTFRYHVEQPIYINMIQEPATRLASWYYFIRFNEGHIREMSDSDRYRVSNYYRPQTKLREGNVFTGVCDSVRGGVCLPAPRGVSAPGGGSWSQGGLLLWGGGLSALGGCLLLGGSAPGGPGPRGGVCPMGGAWWRPPDGHCCGRYTSYWNAFLFFHVDPCKVSCFSHPILHIFSEH